MDGGRHVPDAVRLEQAAHAMAAKFARRAADHDRDGSFPFENFDALHSAGLMNIVLPAARGGGDAGLITIARVVGAIAAGDASTALVLLMHYLQMASVLRSNRWPAHLREHVVQASIDGVALINTLRVEPELGTPARGGLPATTARRVAEGWRITGRKIYSTGSPALRYGLVWARTADEEPTVAGPMVGMFLMPVPSPGLRIEMTWDHLGMRASGSHDVVLEDVLIPADHAVDIRPPAEWLVRDPIQGIWSTVGVSALYDGVARAARDWLVSYLHTRKPANLGAALATLPRFQEAVGRIEAMLEANRILIEAVAAAADADPSAVPPTRASLVKMTVTDNSIAAVGLAMELVGNPGLSRTNPLERHHRDVLCSRVHTPQNDMIMLAAGRQALGL
jgi:alkylation response protein AidB-like acyl-CoA dehydrogenase